jgi:hypothetical protein
MTLNPIVERYMTNRLLPFQERYEIAELRYAQNGMYDKKALGAYYQVSWIEALKPLRDVGYRSVEFFANKVMQGPIQVVTDNDALKEAINQILRWSNFDEKKQLYLRQDAKLGDLFWKVNNVNGKIFIDNIYPGYVVDFEEDSRGYLTKIRIEVPKTTEDGQLTNQVEYWQKGETPQECYYSVWETDQTYPVGLEELGTPIDFGPIAAFGIDFLNFVHVKFIDVGEDRGYGCFTHAQDKMDEANRQATRLAQMVFKRAGGVWTLSSSNVDKDNRPMAPAKMLDANGNQTNILDVSEDALITLPAGHTLTPTIPTIAWGELRNIANDMVSELKEDMPELRYYDSVEGANLSGKALGVILAPALDRAREASNNFATGLSRVLKMALTMGQYARLLQVSGTYDNGDFDHTIVIPEVFSQDAGDKAIVLGQLKTAGLDLFVSMKMAGYTADEIKEAQTAAQTAADAKANQIKNTLSIINQTKA